MIQEAKSQAWQQINSILIKLYWNVGCYVSSKIENQGWGKSVVEELAKYISQEASSIKGFSARNIWRMKQFYEMYRDYEKLSALLTEISWSNHLHIMTKTKSVEEKEYYLALAAKYRYSERDFARLIDSSTFERTMLADIKLSAALTDLPGSKGHFKDTYVFEFLDLPNDHKEHDLRKALLRNLRKFLIELGSDFSFIGEEYLLQALDCDVKKPHENPSIGILICKTKDDEVVQYALNRNVSPTMIAEYETKLIDKSVLQKKLQEFSVMLETGEPEVI